MELQFSFIVPVYNRPQEIRELLESMVKLYYKKSYEIVIVEDGSTLSCKEVVEEFKQLLPIQYFTKPNSGPGDSRNFGMKHASGNYFLILDSDVLLPVNYLKRVEEELKKDFVHCFGGPDRSHESFSSVQKGIDYAMTSFFTTGGIRGNKVSVQDFEPRSFNMGLSRQAFEASGGFGSIHPGEDPDLSIRLRELGYATKLVTAAFVYHKRRIDWAKFQQQVYKFGLVRGILIKWHPQTFKFTYFFPTLSLFFTGFATVLSWFGIHVFVQLLLLYGVLIFLDASRTHKNIYIGVLAVLATLIQFFGYGIGFLQSIFQLFVMSQEPEEAFPKLFFAKN
jgi:glycosyltransferase involved in cell wall biosynthesis